MQFQVDGIWLAPRLLMFQVEANEIVSLEMGLSAWPDAVRLLALFATLVTGNLHRTRMRPGTRKQALCALRHQTVVTGTLH